MGIHGNKRISLYSELFGISRKRSGMRINKELNDMKKYEEFFNLLTDKQIEHILNFLNDENDFLKLRIDLTHNTKIWEERYDEDVDGLHLVKCYSDNKTYCVYVPKRIKDLDIFDPASTYKLYKEEYTEMETSTIQYSFPIEDEEGNIMPSLQSLSNDILFKYSDLSIYKFRCYQLIDDIYKNVFNDIEKNSDSLEKALEFCFDYLLKNKRKKQELENKKELIVKDNLDFYIKIHQLPREQAIGYFFEKLEHSLKLGYITPVDDSYLIFFGTNN